MSIGVRINKTYDSRTLRVVVSVNAEKIADTDLRRFRRALADAITETFIKQGHRLEELKNLEVNRKPSRVHRNVVWASADFIGDIKREEFERFSAVFLQLLIDPGQYDIEVVRGLKALHWQS